MKKHHIYRYLCLAASIITFASFIGHGASGLNERKTGIPAKTFYAALVDNKNTKWFLTELGIISYTGDKWTLHNENNKIGSSGLKDFAYRNNPGGAEFWVVSPSGATVSSLPFDDKTEAHDFRV